MKTYSLCILLSILASASLGNVRREFMFGHRRGGSLLTPVGVAKRDFPELWFTQKFDHFNPTDERTWSQRFFVNDELYAEPGAAFLMLGGEGTASPTWLEYGNMYEYAKTSGAIIFVLEHRYYGQSRPTEDMSLENLRFLSSEQALADAATFISWANGAYNLTTDTKWVAFGGSYSGSLAAWLRFKYPHLVHGAVSSSGPILAQVDFQDYFRVVSESLGTSSADCVSSVKEAFAAITSSLQDPSGYETLDTLFNLCEPIADNIDNPQQLSNFQSSLSDAFAGVVQYNNIISSRPTIDDVCSVMTNTSIGSPLERLAAYVIDSSDCLDYNYDSMIEEFKNVSWEGPVAETYRPWTYQTCTEFGFYQTSSYESHVFGDGFPIEFFIQMCQDIFDEAFNSDYLDDVINHTNVIYGGLDIEVSNVVFVHGSIDPWHALGLLETVDEEAPAIYINGTAHCANMVKDSDPPELAEAIDTIGDLVQTWLAQT